MAKLRKGVLNRKQAYQLFRLIVREHPECHVKRLPFISKTGSQTYFYLEVAHPHRGGSFLISSRADWERFKERLSRSSAANTPELPRAGTRLFDR